MSNAKGSVKKVVLAYSGGLDTSIIIPWLKEHYGGAEVIAFCGDVGQGDDYDAVTKKALQTGASKCVVRDLREEFVRDYCYKALSAGAVYEDRYLLGTALARPLLAYHQVQVALEEGADALSHGATGKGNDQVRFEVTYGAFAPHLKVIAPWREWTIRSREDALDYAAKHDVPGRADEEGPVQPRRQPLAPLARGRQPRGRVGRAAEGACSSSRSTRSTRRTSRRRSRSRSRAASPVALDGKRLAPIEMIETLNRVGGRPRRRPARPGREPAGRHQVARRLRDARRHGAAHRAPRARAAGARPRHAALQAVRSRCATRSSIYDGLWFSTLREALAAFVDETEKEVTGEVRLRLYKGTAEAVGRRSPRSLYRQDLATFGDGHGVRPPGRRGLHPPVRPARARPRADPRPRDHRREGGRDHQPRPARGSDRTTVGVTAPLGFRAAAVRVGHQARPARPRAAGGRRTVRRGRRLHHATSRRRRRSLRLAGAPRRQAARARSW